MAESSGNEMKKGLQRWNIVRQRGVFVGAFIRSWFTDALYKAESYTAAYNVFWWIFTGLSVFSFFFGDDVRRRSL